MQVTTRVTVRVYRPTHTKEKSPKLKTSWEGPYKVGTQINKVVYRIQTNPRWSLMVVHLDWLASYQVAEGSSRSGWRVNSAEKPSHRKEGETIKDVISTALGKEGTVIHR
jgi:hypothetical protein